MEGNYWDIRPLPQRTRTQIPKLTQIPKRRYTRRIQIPPGVYEYVDPFEAYCEIPNFEEVRPQSDYEGLTDVSSDTPFQLASSSSSDDNFSLDPRDSIYWEEAQEKYGDLGSDDNIIDLYQDIKERVWKRQK